ncbi:MAG: hypothetical protein GX307_05220 [Euryarchaeota archaeon]|nr:hypothetical protein [Euryarchaeota archaeon]
MFSRLMGRKSRGPVRRDTCLFAALAGASLVCAWAVGIFVDQRDLIYSIILPTSYLLLGMLIKYGDQAFDANVYSQHNAIALALPGGLWMGAIMLYDAGTTMIFVGLLIGLLVAHKYDNGSFQLAFIVAMAMGVAALLMRDSLSVLGIASVIILAVLDEKIDSLPVDENTVISKLFHQRPMLKIGVLILCVAGMLPSFMYLFAFLSFDFGYSLVDVVSTSRSYDG